MLSQLFSRRHQKTETRTKKSTPGMFEPLEGRALMSAVPAHATTIQGDNRGEVLIKVSKTLQTATVNASTCKIFTAGKDKKLNTADDVVVAAAVTLNKSKTIITMRGNLAADTAYRVQLLSNSIKDTDGLKLDGEFNGPNLITGNGVQGGDCNFRIRPTTSALPVARFYTSLGNVDVSLYRGATASNSAAPNTVAHFLVSVNAGTYDDDVIYRSDSHFVVQWGDVNMDPKTGALSANVDKTQHNLTSELGTNSNVRGTISFAMNGLGTSSEALGFFFNISDNGSTNQTGGDLDDRSPPFTPFGKAKNAASLAVLDAINALKRLNFGGTALANLKQGLSVNQWPVNPTITVTGDSQTSFSNGGGTNQTITFLKDFVSCRRVAVLGTPTKLS